MSVPFRYQWRDAIRELDVPPSVKLVAHELASHMNDAGLAHPSMEDMTRHTSLGPRTILRALQRLQDDYLLETAQSHAPGRATVRRAMLPSTTSTSGPEVVEEIEVVEATVPASSPSSNSTVAAGLLRDFPELLKVTPVTPVKVTPVTPVPPIGDSSAPQQVTTEPEQVTPGPPTGDNVRGRNPLNPFREPSINLNPRIEQPLMSKEDPRIQKPLDELCKLSDEWKRSRPHVERLALHVPCIAEALEAALESERQKPGSIIGATRWTRKVAHRINGKQQHQGRRAAEREFAASEGAGMVPQFKKPEEAIR